MTATPLSTQTRPGRSHPGGFTLIEILLAVSITAMIMTLVGGSFLALLQAREEVSSMSESTTAGPRILAVLERDLRGLWHHNVKDNRVLIGRNFDIAGFDADRIDMVTTTDAVGVVVDPSGTARRPSLCEVSYWLRENPRYPQLRELWRREDPMLDDDIQAGGTFQLVHDRIRNFNITYYREIGAEAEEFVEWDSSEEDRLPRRIKVEFTVERKLPNRNRVTGSEIGADVEASVKKYVRHFVFDRRYPDILKGGVALVPVIPDRPEAAGPGGGGGGGGPAAAQQTLAGPGGQSQRGRGAAGRAGRGVAQGQNPGLPGRGRGTGQRGGNTPPGLPPPGAINFQELLRGGGTGLGGSGGMQGLFNQLGGSGQ